MDREKANNKNKFCTQKVSFAMNTWEPCLLVLKKHGCSLHFIPPENSDNETGDNALWVAEYKDKCFYAYDPVSLLGLFSMWMNRGDDWSVHEDEKGIYDRLLDGEVV